METLMTADRSVLELLGLLVNDPIGEELLSAVALIIALIHTLKALFFVAAELLNYLEMKTLFYTRDAISCSSCFMHY